MIIRAWSREFYVFWHKFYAWPMCCIQYNTYIYVHMCYMIRMIRDTSSTNGWMLTCPQLFFVGFSVLSHWRKAIFAFSCQDVLAFAARGVAKWAGKIVGHMRRAKQLLQAMIYFRPIWARGCPSNGPHQRCMPRKTRWKGEGEEEYWKNNNKKKIYDIDWIYGSLEWISYLELY